MTATDVPTAESAVPPVADDRRRDLVHRLRSYPWLPALATAVVLVVVGQIISPGYGHWNNINEILASSAILALAASGQNFVMVSGNYGIDLSIGQVMSLTAVLAYISMRDGDQSLIPGILAVVGIGAAFGLVNGVLVAWAKLPALVVTLGTLVVAQGAIIALTSGGTPNGAVPPLLGDITSNSIGGIRYVTIVVAVIIGLLVVLMRRSRFGRNLYVVGSNREAARLSGVPVGRTVVLAFVAAGVCGGIAGLLLLSYAGTANLNLGGDYLLLSIAATVVGGTSLAGGEGGPMSSAAGAVALQVITTFLLTVGVSDAVRQIVTGGLLLVLLAFNYRIPRLRQ